MFNFSNSFNYHVFLKPCDFSRRCGIAVLVWVVTMYVGMEINLNLPWLLTAVVTTLHRITLMLCSGASLSMAIFQSQDLKGVSVPVLLARLWKPESYISPWDFIWPWDCSWWQKETSECLTEPHCGPFGHFSSVPISSVLLSEVGDTQTWEMGFWSYSGQACAGEQFYQTEKRK